MTAEDPWELRSKPPRSLRDALEFLVDNQDDAARDALADIAGTPDRRTSRKLPPREVQVARLYEDAFSCRHCGKGLLPVPVLRAASLFWPDELPAQTNWASGAAHPLYLQFAATFDLANPEAFGGADRFENLLTSCWSCNATLSPLFLPSEGGRLTEPRHPKWKGLVPQYLQLESRVRELSTDQWNRVHRLWMRDFQAVENSVLTS